MFDIETLAGIALLGGAYDWRQTPIQVTAAALATDPTRLAQEGWWKGIEPRDSSNREIIRLVERRELKTADGQEEAGRLDRRTTARQISQRQRDKAQRRREGADELIPTDSESIQEWFARLAKAVDANGPKKIFFDGLRSYASRFRGDASARRTLDGKLVAAFLRNVGGTN